MKRKGKFALGAILLASQLFSAAVPAFAATESAESKRCASYSEECVSVAMRSDIEVASRFKELFFGKKKKTEAHIVKKEEQKPLMLCPGGDVFGIKIDKSAVSVVKTDEDCILKAGDIIISIDDEKISSLAEVKDALEKSNGKTLNFVVKRGEENIKTAITPKMVDGCYKIGAVLKDGVAGIGTVTYYDPVSGKFGGLGHAICDSGSTEPVKMTHGGVCGVILGAVDKSKEGDPGELTGLLTDSVLGELHSNTDEGVFGKFNTPPDLTRKMLPVASKSEIQEGEATIISTVKNGHRAEYKIEIFDIDRASDGSKSFKIRVTDEALKAATGGIVRGMSGSPIIQNGKIVGAVTHVLVANPTEGYGIFIENMLSAAQAMPKAA